jgi:GT2 family glycosyltransferase
LTACTSAYAVSLDDDSYPIDLDFFSEIEQLFASYPQVGILAARIWHRGETIQARSKSFIPAQAFIGCGHAVRTAAYRQVRGYLPRPIAYGMEETDLAIQFMAAGWKIFESGDLRVFHDTNLKHHQSEDITAASIANVGLYVFLHYPISGWGWGFLQVANKVAYCLRKGRIRGTWSGIVSIPADCYRHRAFRQPKAWGTVSQLIRLHKTGVF